MSKKRNKKLSKHEQEELDLYLEKEKSTNMNPINIKKITLTPKQLDLMDTIRKNKITVVTGPAGTSKAQPLTSKILTPTGWKLMGDIKVNDLVIGVNGKPTKVLGVFPQGIKEIFKVKFSDGSSTECTGDHLWLTWNVSERNYYKKKNNIKIKTEHSGTVRNTEEIKDTLFGSGGRLNHSIPIVKPIEFKTQNYYIEPYLMGALLGDGHLGRYIGFSTNDNELFEKINNILLVKEHKLKVRSKKGKFVECAIIRECNENSNANIPNLISDNIGELGLLNTLSDTKFIPEIYLFGSIEQRVELLQGLLDTDGTVTRGCIKFTTVSSKLRDDMISLIRSLGGTVTYNISKPTYTYKGKKMQGKDAYFLNINLPEEIASRCFSLERKQKLVKPRVKYFPIRYITDISKVRDDLAQCIMVEDENHLYITDDYIVTHNTFSSCFTSLIELKKLNYKKIIITKPTEIVSGTQLGFLPGPQPIFSKILTPNGWTTMGEIKKGDYVSTPDGGKAKVLDVFDKGKKDIYEIDTLHGKTYACNDHLWATKTHNEHKQKKPFKIRNTEEIANTLMNESINKLNHYLPKCEPIHFDKKDLPIPPYVLGALLGDGSFCNDTVIISSIDDEIIERFKNELGSDFNIKNYNDNDINYYISTKNKLSRKNARPVKITKNNVEYVFETVGDAHKNMQPDINIETFKSRCHVNMEIDSYKYEYLEKTKNYTNTIKNDLENLSLLGLKSYEKFIPECYKYSSIEDRIAILQGLMDTDGSCKKNGEASFGTTSLELANDIVEITKSLGGYASMRTRDRINEKLRKINGREIKPTRVSYEVYINLPDGINPFYLSRKADRFKTKFMHHNKIKSIIKQDEQVECKCILIDHPDHLYITDDFIVTHNTLEEKIKVYMKSFISVFSKMLTGEQLKAFMDEKIIEFVPAQFVRGDTFDDSIIIIDEFQSFDISTLMAIVTRLGKNSKMIFVGDAKQNDINKKYVAVDTFKHILDGVEDTDTFEFNRDDIVRDKILIDIIDNYERLEAQNSLPQTQGNK